MVQAMDTPKLAWALNLYSKAPKSSVKEFLQFLFTKALLRPHKLYHCMVDDPKSTAVPDFVMSIVLEDWASLIDHGTITQEAGGVYNSSCESVLPSCYNNTPMVFLSTNKRRPFKPSDTLISLKPLINREMEILGM